MTAATAGGATELFGLPMGYYVSDSLPGIPGPTLNSGTAHRLLTRSPLHAFESHPRLNPVWQEKTADAFDLGSAVHSVLLEDRADILAIYPGDTWRSGDAKQFKEQARSEGRIPLLSSQSDGIIPMVAAAKAAIANSPDLKDLGPLDAEITYVWEQDGAWLRCRPDWLTRDRKIVLSYKTTAANAEPDSYTRTLTAAGYPMQATFERAAIKAAHGIDATYIWVIGEIQPPYAVSLLGLSPEMADYGRSQMDAAVALWAECLKTDTWPGYPERVAWIETPSYARYAWEEKQMAAAGERPARERPPYLPMDEEEYE